MSVRITRSAIALGLCLLSGCIAFNEASLRSGTPEEVREELSAMLNETNASSRFRGLLGSDGANNYVPINSNTYLRFGVRNLVSVINNEALWGSGSGDYPEQTRLEALRQLIEYAKTPEATTPSGWEEKAPAEGIRAALVYTYNRTATDAMKREILSVFDTPEMYPMLISNGRLYDVSDEKDWTPTTTPVYESASNHYHGSSEAFSPLSSDWVAVFEACPSQAQWSALFDRVTKWRIEALQERRYCESFNISRLSEIYDKIKQPTYEQKYAALVLLNSFSRNTIYVLDRKEPEYKTYIRSVSDAQKKALNSMPKSEVLQLLKDLEPFRKKNIAFDRLYIWVWLKRVATHQQRADFAKAETDALNQEKQQLQQEFAQKEAQRKAREEAYNRQQEQDRKTRVVIYCNICGCRREDNKLSATRWRINGRPHGEPREIVSSGGSSYIPRGGTECPSCPHVPSFHRIVEQ
ncbi:MAG: hypothetical protein ACI4YA_07090 [Candidatus Spyradenecus sp.]